MRNLSGSAVLTKTEAVLLLCSLPLAISKRPTDCARPGFTVQCSWSTVTQTQEQPGATLNARPGESKRKGGIVMDAIAQEASRSA